MPLSIYVDNNNCVEIQSLTNTATDVVDIAATVTVTLLDSAGDEVVGQTWPAAMTHVAAGTYRATLESDLVLIPARAYTAVIDAAGSGNEAGHWELPVQAWTRNT